MHTPAKKTKVFVYCSNIERHCSIEHVSKCKQRLHPPRLIIIQTIQLLIPPQPNRAQNSLARCDSKFDLRHADGAHMLPAPDSDMLECLFVPFSNIIYYDGAEWRTGCW